MSPASSRGCRSGLAGRVDGHLATFAEYMCEGLLAASTAVGLEVMAELMDADVTELVGPKGRHDPTRTMNRHGSQPASVTLGAACRCARPRVRTVAGDDGEPEREVPLESYTTFAAADQLAEGMVARMLAGISTRRYRVALEPVGAQVERTAQSTSKSAVSRRFVNATAEQLAELCARLLDDHRWLVVYLDGFSFGDHTLGVTLDGTKITLGVVEGSTENAAVCTRLVSDLAARGLDATRGVLFVVDGGKAIAKAVDDVFGDLAVTQRCRIHRVRNVTAKVSDVDRDEVKTDFWAIFDIPDHFESGDAAVADASRRTEVFAGKWRAKYPGAVACVVDYFGSLTTFLRFPREHWRRIRHTNLNRTHLRRVATQGESHRRLPGERSCLSLVWAVLDRASRGWGGMDMNPANVRLLQQLRAELFRPHHPPSEEVTDLPETIPAVA